MQDAQVTTNLKSVTNWRQTAEPLQVAGKLVGTEKCGDMGMNVGSLKFRETIRFISSVEGLGS